MNTKPRLMMNSYAATYGCGGSDAAHVCSDCPDGNNREFARTRSSGFIKESFLPTLLATPITASVWEAAITAGNIIMIPKTSGSADPGSPKELKGYGDRPKSYGPRLQKLSFNDPDYLANYHFYNEISDRTDLVPFYRTSSLVHIYDKPASIIASDPAADDLEEEIVWNVVCEVISKNLPAKFPIATIKSVFSCATF
jgi:hypothetical protein